MKNKSDKELGKLILDVLAVIAFPFCLAAFLFPIFYLAYRYLSG